MAWKIIRKGILIRRLAPKVLPTPRWDNSLPEKCLDDALVRLEIGISELHLARRAGPNLNPNSCLSRLEEVPKVPPRRSVELMTSGPLSENRSTLGRLVPTTVSYHIPIQDRESYHRHST